MRAAAWEWEERVDETDTEDESVRGLLDIDIIAGYYSGSSRVRVRS